MAGTVAQRLAELGIELPEAPQPVANYVPYVATGKLIFVSGQIPVIGGEVRFAGKLGADISIEDGIEAARLCGINLISQLAAALAGDLDRVKRVVKLTGFVNSTSDFTGQATIINGVSDLMAEVFGDAGRHARAAVGAASLPLGAAVEVDGVFETA